MQDLPMRFPLAACLVSLSLLALGPGGAVAQDAKSAAKASGKKTAQDKTAAGDKKVAADKKAAGDTKKADAAEEQKPRPGTESSPEDASGGWFSDMIHSGATGLLIDGGWFMLPILLMGIIASGVIIERYRSLKMIRSDTGEVRQQVLELLSMPDRRLGILVS